MERPSACGGSWKRPGRILVICYPRWFPPLTREGGALKHFATWKIPDNITMGGDRLLLFATPWTRYPLPEIPGSSATVTDHSQSVAASRRSARVGTALTSGFLLFLLLSYFRLEKASGLGLDLSLGNLASLLLPELASVLVLEGILILLARLPGRWGAGLWWPLFVVFHVLAFTGSLLEHVFFLHTESRLNLSLLRYGFDNFEMLEGLILSGVDDQFTSLAKMTGALFLVGLLAGFFLRVRRPQRWYWMAPAGIALALLPATSAVTRSDLASSTLRELLPGPSASRETERRAARWVVAPEELYRTPRYVAPAVPEAVPEDISEEPPSEPQEPPNIVLVVLESTRWDPLVPYNPKGDQLAPELAAIARRSWVVEEMYGTVSHTSKALVGILCGMFPRLALPIDEAMEDGLPLTCLPHLLEKAGYRTVFLQTAMSGFENRPGLVRNLGYASAAFMETVDRPGFERIGYLGLDEFAMLEPAKSILAGAGPEPFFLTLLTLTPHHPYHVAGEPPPTGDSNPLEHYLAALRHQDRFIGEVYRALEARGLLENTILVLVGDHGEAFGEHRRRQHDVVPYEEVIRVPAFLHLPERFGEPRRISGLRQLTDLFPTLLNLAQVSWEGTVPGKDLFSTAGSPRLITSCWYTDYCLAMREGDRKYVYHYGIRPTEVFDLATDPGELDDLAPRLDEEEIRSAEERMLAFKLSIDGFWDQQAAPGTDRLWWNRPAPGSTNP